MVAQGLLSRLFKDFGFGRWMPAGQAVKASLWTAQERGGRGRATIWSSKSTVSRWRLSVFAWLSLWVCWGVKQCCYAPKCHSSDVHQQAGGNEVFSPMYASVGTSILSRTSDPSDSHSYDIAGVERQTGRSPLPNEDQTRRVVSEQGSGMPIIQHDRMAAHRSVRGKGECTTPRVLLVDDGSSSMGYRRTVHIMAWDGGLCFSS